MFYTSFLPLRASTVQESSSCYLLGSFLLIIDYIRQVSRGAEGGQDGGINF